MAPQTHSLVSIRFRSQLLEFCLAHTHVSTYLLQKLHWLSVPQSLRPVTDLQCPVWACTRSHTELLTPDTRGRHLGSSGSGTRAVPLPWLHSVDGWACSAAAPGSGITCLRALGLLTAYRLLKHYSKPAFLLRNTYGTDCHTWHASLVTRGYSSFCFLGNFVFLLCFVHAHTCRHTLHTAAYPT